MAAVGVRRASRLRPSVAIAVALALSGGSAASAEPVTAAPTATQGPHSTVRTVAAPSDGIEAYIEQVYWDLFDRPVDPVGLAGWSARLRSGTPRQAVADAITGSEEFRMGLIENAYQTYLGRESDPAGMQGWLRAMANGLTIQQLEAGFLASPEFYALAYNDDGWYVKNLYLTVLGRDGAPLEKGAWALSLFVARMTGGSTTRESVALGFLLSHERLSMDLQADYEWLLCRGLDSVGQEGWVRAIQQGVRYEVVVGSIIASDEYWSLVQQ